MALAKLKSNGDIVDIEYDDDDLYLVKDRGCYVYRNEFEYIDTSDVVITIESLKDALYSLPDYYLNMDEEVILNAIIEHCKKL